MKRTVKEIHMPELNLPEVKLPEFKLPEALRDMNRDDIVNAARDVRMPKMSDLPDIDLSKIELPKQITDHLPKRQRQNPILPIAALVAVGAAIAAAWWLITSPLTGPRIRSAVDGIKSRMNGEPTDLVAYDGDVALGSLLTDGPDVHRSSMSSSPYTSPNGISEPDLGVPVGPGEMPEGVRSN
jgi:hypothetical protein